MGAAFEVNKQMCDIEKDLSEAGYFRKICEGQIEARKKLIDMEKKKMTKAEAFKYLDEAKIYVDGQIEAVLEKLFEIGFTWRTGGQQVDIGWSRDDEAYGLIIHDGELCWVDKECSVSWFDNHYMPNELRAEDVLSIEVVEDTKPGCERNEHVKALQEFIVKSGCIDCIIISKNDIGILKK